MKMWILGGVLLVGDMFWVAQRCDRGIGLSGSLAPEVAP